MSGCDRFNLARLAVHSSMTITQRYVHPQADARERASTAFGNLGTAVEPKNLEWGQSSAPSRITNLTMPCKLLVRKGGLEPPRFYPPDPKSGASANSATFARTTYILAYRHRHSSEAPVGRSHLETGANPAGCNHAEESVRILRNVAGDRTSRPRC